MKRTVFGLGLRQWFWVLGGGLLLLGIGLGLWAGAEWYFALPEGIPARFVGRESCLECHPKETAAWMESEHARSMALASSETVLGDFNDAEYLEVSLEELPSRLQPEELALVIETASDELWCKVLAGASGEFREKILQAMPTERRERIGGLIQSHAATSPGSAMQTDGPTSSAASPGTKPPAESGPMQHPAPSIPAGVSARARLELGDLVRRLEKEGRLKTSFGLRYRMFQKDGKFYMRAEGPDGALHDYEIKYLLGHRALQQYLVEFPEGAVRADGSRIPKGSLQALPLAWDVQGRRWFSLYPGETIRPNDPLHWTGRLFNGNSMCIECHATGVRRGYDPGAHAYHTTFSEVNVSCEACHGPADAHVRLARSKRFFWDRRYGVGLPRLTRTDAAVQMDVCAPCHARRHGVFPDQPEEESFTDQPRRFLDYYLPALFDHRMPYIHPRRLYHADGQILEEDYEYGSFAQSKMFRQGVECRDCHSIRTRQYYPNDNSLCTNCHLGRHPAQQYDTPQHHFHPVGKPGSRCVDCHMPESFYMVVDSRRDHSFRAPWPEGTIALGVPNACNHCHTDAAKGETPEWAAQWIRSWYPSPKTQPPSFAQAIAAGRQRRPDADRLLLEVVRQKELPAIVRASALLLLGDYPWPSARPGVWLGLEDPDPLLRATALSLLQEATEQELEARVVPRLTDPVRAVRLEAARALIRHGQKSLGGDHFHQVWKELLDGLNALADQAEAHVELAILYDHWGQEQQAQQSYETALRLDPQLVIARNNLGILYARQAQQAWDQLRWAEKTGQTDSLERLRQLVAEKTALAEAQYRAGLEVQPHLLELRDNLARLYYSVGRSADAEAEFRKLIADAPDQPGPYFSLAQLLAEDEARLSEAAQLLAQAVQLAPRQARIRYNYGLALQKLGQSQKAEQELLAALELDPAEADYTRALAILYAQQGRWPQAVEMARRTASLRPHDPLAQRMLEEFQRRAQHSRQ